MVKLRHPDLNYMPTPNYGEGENGVNEGDVEDLGDGDNGVEENDDGVLGGVQEKKKAGEKINVEADKVENLVQDGDTEKSRIFKDSDSGEEDINVSGDELDITKGSDSEDAEGNKCPVFRPAEILKPVHAYKVKHECTFQIRTYVPKHTCGASFKVKNMKSKWLTEKYLRRFKTDPKRNVSGFRQDAIDETQCHISEDQVYRAKRRAIRMIERTQDDQFKLFWNYCDEIRRTNPGSTVILGTDQSSGGKCV
ncbi:hypothetical protein BUALT_Bualt15G0097700 [Buddleja alternifolia]|uniref:Transposase n=1 Tax=Buddleja alternifolia TaxID=168488 RepID=A0AAV6WEJ4_9LAMI|nr:hypothetical protein BUALT_Bualt15G0097700 [Buddleja alternifolia]